MTNEEFLQQYRAVQSAKDKMSVACDYIETTAKYKIGQTVIWGEYECRVAQRCLKDFKIAYHLSGYIFGRKFHTNCPILETDLKPCD